MADLRAALKFKDKEIQNMARMDAMNKKKQQADMEEFSKKQQRQDELQQQLQQQILLLQQQPQQHLPFPSPINQQVQQHHYNDQQQQQHQLGAPFLVRSSNKLLCLHIVCSNRNNSLRLHMVYSRNSLLHLRNNR